MQSSVCSSRIVYSVVRQRNILQSIAARQICTAVNEETRFLGSAKNLQLYNDRRSLRGEIHTCKPRVGIFKCCQFSSFVGSRICWSCKSTVDPSTVMLCGSCGCLLEVNQKSTYFEVFNLSEHFKIDSENLTKQFRYLQSQLHPDKFVGKSEKEQLVATDYSSFVNRAYRTIMKPLSRGIYMLELRGKALKEGEIEMQREFLMKVLEINETLAETTNVDIIQCIRKENKQLMIDLFERVEMAFAAENITDAQFMIAELKYYTNIEEKAKKLEETCGIYHD